MGLLSVLYQASAVALSLAGLANAAQACDAAKSFCYSEAVGANLTLRVAIPAVDKAPFDILFQLVAPKATAGWGAIAWGGSMVSNPLTVAWANANRTMVSSRWAEYETICFSYFPRSLIMFPVLQLGEKTYLTNSKICQSTRTPPAAYPGATYTVLKSSTVNATHWTLTALCSGCANWTVKNAAKSLNPNDKAVKIAYAMSANPPPRPENNATSIPKHNVHGYITLDLAAARTDKFEESIQALSWPDGLGWPPGMVSGRGCNERRKEKWTLELRLVTVSKMPVSLHAVVR